MASAHEVSCLTIDFIWSSLCPNVSVCREVIHAAIEQFQEHAVVVHEWQTEAQLPSHCEGYGSPTILVNGTDVTAVKSTAYNECCRVYATMYEIRSVPLVEEVVVAMALALKASIESTGSGPDRA